MPKYFPGFEGKLFDCGDAQIYAVYGGSGKDSILLLHGYPQTHIVYRKIAPRLAEKYTVVCADLRGYGHSSCPPEAEDHSTYSKSNMALDMVRLMSRLGFERFYLVGHDRGGRVSHQLMVDHPQRVIRGMLLDIAPTLALYEMSDKLFSTSYWHWYFLIQERPFVENIIERDVRSYLLQCFNNYKRTNDVFPKEVMEEYIERFSRREGIYASTEDYRAGASVDYEKQKSDRAAGRRIRCPLRVIWGEAAMRYYDIVKIWSNGFADDVSGWMIPGVGHWLAEEAPDQIYDAIMSFFK
jgi:haloacetate dehalogenase